jgi:putative DNA primase/helicase
MSGNNGAAEIIARAQRVHANGYLPVPVLRYDAPPEVVVNGQRRRQSPGKQPHGRIWSLKEDYVYGATTASIARWHRIHGIEDCTNLGIACGQTVCVDIDVYDPELAEQVEALARQQLGPTALVRFGQRPKRALVYRAAGDPLAKAQTPELLKGELKAKVEVLGQGQMLVAFGTHPATRAPYEWSGPTPETLPAAELTPVTEAQVRGFVAEAEALLRAEDYRTRAELQTPPGQSGGERVAGDDLFRRINDEALRRPDAWVPTLFGNGAYKDGRGVWRVPSSALGRDREEDISIAPNGIVDFGEHDMGDPRVGKRTAIDLVMEHGGAADATAAARWLADRLGIDAPRLSTRARANGHDKGQTEPPLGDSRLAVQGKEAPWPDPAPLPEGLPTVQPFDAALLPDELRPWVEDIAERMQAPADYPAVGAMIAAGTVTGRQIGIRPKRHDDWTVVPNLWGGIVGRPGLLKTPALQEATRSLVRLEMAAKQAFEQAEAEHEGRREIAKQRKKLREHRIARDLKDNRDPRGILHDLIAEGEEEGPPARRRYLVNDSSIEKLGEILNQNPRGVLVFRDELVGLLRQMERDGHEQDRAFYLEAWNGTGRFTYDRIGRGTLDIEAACVSVLGGIQPGPLTSYLEAMAHAGASDDGLLQRFQLLVWPDVAKAWTNVDRAPDPKARQAASEVFDRLDPLAISARQDRDGGIPYLRFDDEAQGAFDEWRGGLEARLRDGSLHPAMEAHLAKYRSLVPALALLCHLVDGGRGPVGSTALARALAWAEYLESHARRIYDAVIRGDLCAARALGERIERGDLPSPFKIRDVYRPGWAGLSSPETAAAAVSVLVDLDWLQAEEIRSGPGGGRPSVRYHINPKLGGRS